MQNVYGIASFRSRQQVLRFEDSLHREGVSNSVMTTPREVAMGCGLSVRFDIKDADRVKNILRRDKPTNLIGVYRVEQTVGRPKLSVIH